jgi:hypothetical protein
VRPGQRRVEVPVLDEPQHKLVHHLGRAGWIRSGIGIGDGTPLCIPRGGAMPARARARPRQGHTRPTQATGWAAACGTRWSQTAQEKVLLERPCQGRAQRGRAGAGHTRRKAGS